MKRTLRRAALELHLRAGIPLLFGLLVAGAEPAHAQHSRIEQNVKTATLDNGLEVIVTENRSVPLATVLVAVRNGAFTQEPRDEGLAHLYEHLLFRTYDGDPQAFWRATSEIGGSANGTTNEEVVDYFMQVPSSHAKDAVRVLAHLVTNARFSEADLAAERPVVLDELQRDQSDPEGALGRAVSRTLWGPSWSRKDTGGDSASLAGITLARLRDTWNRYYLPNNAALIVTGDVNAAEIVREAAKQFGGWRAGPNPFAAGDRAPIEPASGRRVVVMGGAVQDVTVVLEWQGPSVRRDTPATYGADALFAVFNAPTSPFQQRLVDSGLFRSVGGLYLTLDYVGPIIIQGQTTPGRAQEAITALLDEVDRLDQLDGVTDDDLVLAKKARDVTDALVFERGASLAPGLASWWASAGMEYYAGYQDRLNAQTREDLARFAHGYIAGKPMVMGILASPAVAGHLGEWLRTSTRSMTGTASR